VNCCFVPQQESDRNTCRNRVRNVYTRRKSKVNAAFRSKRNQLRSIYKGRLPKLKREVTNAKKEPIDEDKLLIAKSKLTAHSKQYRESVNVELDKKKELLNDAADIYRSGLTTCGKFLC